MSDFEDTMERSVKRYKSVQNAAKRAAASLQAEREAASGDPLLPPVWGNVDRNGEAKFHIALAQLTLTLPRRVTVDKCVVKAVQTKL